MDLREFLRILRRRWLLILLCMLVGVAAGSLYAIGTTATYASTARLFISTPSTDATTQAYQGGLFSQQRVTSYADLITGSTVAERVIDKLGLSESADELIGRIEATAAPQTVIIEITASDASPEGAQQVAQATAEVFAAYVGELEGANEVGQSPIRANIVDAAGLPTTPVSPRPVRTIGIGLAVGLLAGLIAAWIRETLDTTIKSPQRLAEATGSVTLGVVYFDPGAPSHPLVTDLDPHAPRAEAFRVLCTNTQFLDVDSESKVIVVTSPLPGDGKSTTAINMAITLALSGRRTALLEADLRRPRVASYLQLESAVGLTTVLLGRVDLQSVLQPWGSMDLNVITSGAIPPNPAELLQSKAMAAVIDELHSSFDMVIIDAPPVLPVTDAPLLATAADGAILVARHGSTTRDGAAQARQRLDAVDATLFGAVLNFAPERGAQGYGYGYGYGYGTSADAAAEEMSTDLPDRSAHGADTQEDPTATAAVRNDGPSPTLRPPASSPPAGPVRDSGAVPAEPLTADRG